jgi:transcriptional regulator with XRE-family HTH domain
MARKKQIEHDPIVSRFGRRLRELRASRGLTQAQLAESAGVTVSYITRLEAGYYAPGIDLVQKLATALGTSAADLLPTEDPPPDAVAVLRERARTLFEGLVAAEDQAALSLLVQLLDQLNRASSSGD